MSKLSPMQSSLLKLYKDFKKFCDENLLRYYAVAGTAIGTVRHQGFIPWDDDIDIGMPIEDFNRFKKLVSKKLPKHIGFLESYWMGGKVYDKQSTIIDIRFLNNPKKYHGVYIDIFPLIGLPDEKHRQEKFIEDIKSFQTNAELLEFYPEVSPFSEKEILKWKNYLQGAYDFNSSKTLAAFCFFTCDGDGIRAPIVMPFEDTEMPISSHYDSDLKNHFGDYMKLPPKQDRKTHDEYHIVDLTKPFSEYAKKYSNTDKWLLNIINKNHLLEGKLTQLSNSLQYILQEKELEKDKIAHDLQNTINSKDYKIGHAILKPIRKIKQRITK